MKMSSYGRFTSPVSIAGMPVLNMHAGNVYWLDSNGGGGSKGTFNHPFTTLDDALGHCDADEGDTIMVKPKHAETITGAGGITIDKAGVSIVGLGRYDARPRFLMDGAATVSCLVTSADAGISNCIFAAGHSDVAVFATVTGKGFALENCHFERNTTNENFVTIVSAGAADNDCDGLRVVGNVLDFGGDAGELNPIILNKDTQNVRILDNKIYGDFDTTPYAVIYSANTEHHMDIEIAYNFIHNLHDANAVVGISVGSTTSTGFMHHNYVYALDVAGETPFVSAATGIALFENYYTYDGGTTSGLLLPAVGTLA